MPLAFETSALDHGVVINQRDGLSVITLLRGRFNRQELTIYANTEGVKTFNASVAYMIALTDDEMTMAGVSPTLGLRPVGHNHAKMVTQYDWELLKHIIITIKGIPMAVDDL